MKPIDHARFVQWLLGELFVLADENTAAETALLKASVAQDLRVLALECAA